MNTLLFSGLLPLLFWSITASALQTPPADSAWPSAGQYRPFKCAGAVATDLVADASGAQNERDIVGDTSSPAAQYFTTSSYLFVRLRLEETAAITSGGGAPLAPFGWGFAFDTNNSFASNGYEYAWIVNGISEEFNLFRYAGGTTGKMTSYTPTVASPGWVKTSTVNSGFGGSSDGFIDVAIPLTDFTSLTAADTYPFNAGRIALWIGTSANGTNLDKDFMCWDDNLGAPNLSAITTDSVAIGSFVGFTTGTVPQTTSSVTPTLTGIAPPSMTFTLTEGPNSVSVTSDSNGNWNYTIPSSWNWATGNTYSVSTSISGGTGETASVTVTSGIPPLTVTITSPADNSTVSTSTPAIGGTANANSVVTLSDGINTTTLTADNSGAWTINVPSLWSWSNGNYTVVASVTGGASSTVHITVAIPSISISSPSNPSSISTITPVITGSTGNGLGVTVSDGTHSSSTTANGSGAWSFTVPSSWAWVNGQGYTVTASITNGSQATTAVTVLLQSVSITSPSNGASVSTATPLVSGTATANQVVSISDGTNSETVTTSGSGNWSIAIPSSWGWTSGFTYTVSASLSGGLTSSIGITVSIPTVSIQTPANGSTITSASPAVSGTTASSQVVTLTDGSNSLTATADGSGLWSTQVPPAWNWTDGNSYTLTASLANGASSQSTVTLSIPSLPLVTIASPVTNSVITTKAPVINGTTSPTTVVTVSDGSHAATTTSNSAGNWTFSVPTGWSWVNGQSVVLTAKTHAGASTSSALTISIPDIDQDGVADSIDNCPYVSNSSQTDQDGNGVGDVCDFGVGGNHDQPASGLRATGSGCARVEKSENGLGGLWFSILVFIGIRTYFTHRRHFALGFLSMTLAVPLVHAYTGELDIEQFDTQMPSVGVLNQSYGRINDDPNWTFGAAVIYSNQPLQLIKVDDNDSRTSGSVVPSLVRYELMAHRSFFDFYDFQIALPVVQEIGSPDWLIGGRTNSDIQKTTLGDVRTSFGVDLKRLISHSSSDEEVGVALRTTAWLPTGDVASFHGESSVRLEPRLALDFKRGRTWLGLNAGYLFRRTSQVFHIVNGSALRYGAFARGAFVGKSDWLVTFSGSKQSEKQVNPQNATEKIDNGNYDPREVLFGVSLPTKNFDITAAAGPGLNSAVGSPIFRALLQIAYRPTDHAEIQVPSNDGRSKEARNIAQRSNESKAANAASEQSAEMPASQEHFEDVNILFAFNSYELDNKALAAIDDLITLVNLRSPDAIIKVRGHSDQLGSEKANLRISKLRTDAVVHMLVAAGIKRERIKPEYFGKSQPLSHSKAIVERRKNRRVELRIALDPKNPAQSS